MKKAAVIGLGRFGGAVALELSKIGFEVLAIDNDERMVNEIVDMVTHALIMDSTHREALIDAGLKNFGVAVVGIGENIEASILTTLLLKEIGVPKVIARALNPYHGMILEKIGADKIVFPEGEMGTKLAKSIANPELIDFLEFGDISIAELIAADNMIGKALDELQLRNKYNVNVVAIKRAGKINASPGPKDILVRGDELLVSGHPEDIAKLKKI